MQSDFSEDYLIYGILYLFLPAMNFFLPIDIPLLPGPLRYQDKIYLTGSCFTEHMSRFLSKAKFQVADNTHGILFNPLSICRSMQDVIECREYQAADLFFLDEYWHSWFHHSDFSDLDQERCLSKINDRIRSHHLFLKQAGYIMITLGSAFAYKLLSSGQYVSNNHRAPHHWFSKELLSAETIQNALQHLQKMLAEFNPACKLLFTVSPVRHSRDGVVENNRSKARLLEAIHNLKNIYYFPAYEIVIDVLRDYRFYDADLVHPNYAATQFVWEKFTAYCIDPDCLPTMKEMEEISKAFTHQPKSTESRAHQLFVSRCLDKATALQQRYPYLDLSQEIAFFGRRQIPQTKQ